MKPVMKNQNSLLYDVPIDLIIRGNKNTRSEETEPIF